jgi:hypothetical protein
MENAMKKFLLFIWQLPQHLLALALIKVCREYEWMDNYWPNRVIKVGLIPNAVSLGQYILYPVDESHWNTVILHEIGHSRQSLIFGPLYLLMVGLPSITRNLWDSFAHRKWTSQQRNAWYFGGWPENDADRRAGVVRKL